MISTDEVRALIAKINSGTMPRLVHFVVLCDSFIELSDKFHDTAVQLENVKAELAASLKPSTKEGWICKRCHEPALDGAMFCSVSCAGEYVESYVADSGA